MTKRAKLISGIFAIAIIFSIVLLFIAYLSGVRVFVVQPIGAVPEGRTLIVSGVSKLHAIDSPDAVCERIGTVNLLCRAGVIAGVVDKGEILLRLPYSQFLYNLSGAPETER
ncbi:hypothetical protein H3S84_04540 [Bartonella sp. W8098]|uniref:hypothetical protein n=1 Tax=Bartonella TaxID=773 RepID=UPI0018DE0454|nr:MULTISPECIES: hypothetical protein [Bartonella]MBH9987535.1 hypothetical protein [Bartonella apis]MBI0025370.1 hypothetical protein [Bartonella apihabitans]MBI0171456.1 hypothetical protein [Bartonella sp. W8151]